MSKAKRTAGILCLAVALLSASLFRYSSGPAEYHREMGFPPLGDHFLWAPVLLMIFGLYLLGIVKHKFLSLSTLPALAAEVVLVMCFQPDRYFSYENGVIGVIGSPPYAIGIFSACVTAFFIFAAIHSIVTMRKSVVLSLRAKPILSCLAAALSAFLLDNGFAALPTDGRALSSFNTTVRVMIQVSLQLLLPTVLLVLFTLTVLRLHAINWKTWGIIGLLGVVNIFLSFAVPALGSTQLALILPFWLTAISVCGMITSNWKKANTPDAESIT